MYLFNAFSFNMVSGSGMINYQEVTPEEATELLVDGFESAIGHQDMADLLTTMLGVKVPMNRVNINLKIGDHFLVAQYKGPRLPEGAVSLPEGAKVVFFDCYIE